MPALFAPDFVSRSPVVLFRLVSNPRISFSLWVKARLAAAIGSKDSWNELILLIVQMEKPSQFY